MHGLSRLGGYKNCYLGSPFLRYLIHPLYWEVSGAWMTFKKAEMKKILRNGLIMSKMDHLNHKWQFMSGSCHFDKASNVEIGVECQMFVIVIFFNCSRVLQFGAPSRYYKGALTQKMSTNNLSVMF